MLTLLLQFLSKIYALVMNLRSLCYQRGLFASYQSRLPVLCVGNISAGGSGKTPMCIFLVKSLREKGYRPVVLTRGYKGKQKGPYLVKSDDNAENCGDEALLIARKTLSPVVIACKRAEGARFIEENDLGNLIILDDGFQHLALKRSVDIVLLNVGSEAAMQDLLLDKVIPWGKLREARHAALSRADLIVLSQRKPAAGSKLPDAKLMQILPKNRALFNSYFEAKGVVSCLDGQSLSVQKVVVFCAIANPENFFETVQSLGYEIIEKIVFPDHYFISEQELETIKQKFAGLPLLCTEKDAIRIAVKNYPGIYKLEGSAKIVPSDAFLVQITKRLLAHTQS